MWTMTLAVEGWRQTPSDYRARARTNYLGWVRLGRDARRLALGVLPHYGFPSLATACEVLFLDWCDVAFIWNAATACGVVRLRNPKSSRAPRVQHVVTELPLVRAILFFIWSALGAPQSGRIFPWSPAMVCKEMGFDDEFLWRLRSSRIMTRSPRR